MSKLFDGTNFPDQYDPDPSTVSPKNNDNCFENFVLFDTEVMFPAANETYNVTPEATPTSLCFRQRTKKLDVKSIRLPKEAENHTVCGSCFGNNEDSLYFNKDVMLISRSLFPSKTFPPKQKSNYTDYYEKAINVLDENHSQPQGYKLFDCIECKYQPVLRLSQEAFCSKKGQDNNIDSHSLSSNSERADEVFCSEKNQDNKVNSHSSSSNSERNSLETSSTCENLKDFLSFKSKKDFQAKSCEGTFFSAESCDKNLFSKPNSSYAEKVSFRQLPSTDFLSSRNSNKIFKDEALLDDSSKYNEKTYKIWPSTVNELSKNLRSKIDQKLKPNSLIQYSSEFLRDLSGYPPFKTVSPSFKTVSLSSKKVSSSSEIDPSSSKTVSLSSKKVSSSSEIDPSSSKTVSPSFKTSCPLLKTDFSSSEDTEEMNEEDNDELNQSLVIKLSGLPAIMKKQDLWDYMLSFGIVEDIVVLNKEDSTTAWIRMKPESSCKWAVSCLDGMESPFPGAIKALKCRLEKL